jgi:predicted dehydrogenase
MADSRKLNVAVIGLRFGAQFAPIYSQHPDVGNVVYCDSDEALLSQYAAKFGAGQCFTYEEVLASKEIDAVHLVTPIHAHAQMSVDALQAGKHCACTVPMATTLEQLKEIVAAQLHSGKNYMMMETAVYTYHFLHVQEMMKRGDFGKIQFLRGAHYQDMENWPSYWKGLPPMHYATHAIAPLLAIADTRATGVHCFGSGTMRPEWQGQYGNPYPIETAIFQLEQENLAAEVTRTLFETARSYMEHFNVYGDKASFEWHMENDPPLRFGKGSVQRIELKARPDLLPAEIAPFMTRQKHLEEGKPHPSLLQGGAHHGSHPHLVHEFVRSIVEQRKPRIDAATAANWTAAGICAHESAMNGGKAVAIPAF